MSFAEEFNELENDIFNFLDTLDNQLDTRLLGAVLSKQVVCIIKAMGEDKEMMLRLMEETWDCVIEVEEIH